MKRWSLALVCLILGGLAGTLTSNHLLQGQPPVPKQTVYPKELVSYRDVVKTVLPAVVSIESRAKPTATKTKSRQPSRRPRANEMPGLPDEFRKFFEDVEPGDSPDAPQLG